jgi:hypothetical protein
VTSETPAERMPATVREWTDILARIRFGTVKVGTRAITGARIKLVAARLADYADSDGTRVRPGLARLSLDVEIDYRTAKASVAYLRSIGLLHLVRAGSRNGADEYRLSLPVDLLERDDLEVWSPSRQRLEIERLSDTHRRTSRSPRGGPGSGVSQGHPAPVNDTARQGHPAPVLGSYPQARRGQGAPVKAPEDAPKTGAGGTSRPTKTGAGQAARQGQAAPATDQDLSTTTTDHSGEDFSETVTTPGAPGPATNPESPPRPQRCNHGLPGGLRPDGKPTCALCRVGAPPTATPHDRLADVIQLEPRRTA